MAVVLPEVVSFAPGGPRGKPVNPGVLDHRLAEERSLAYHQAVAEVL
jgi:hypothetical protein